MKWRRKDPTTFLFGLFLALIVFAAPGCSFQPRPLVQPSTRDGCCPLCPPAKNHAYKENVFCSRPVFPCAFSFGRMRNRRNVSLQAASIGFWGNTGLFLVSTMLVKLVYAIGSNSTRAGEQQSAGILNRCPWPFVVFHDPRQFLKDSPTWVMVLWAALWRISRAVVAKQA